MKDIRKLINKDIESVDTHPYSDKFIQSPVVASRKKSSGASNNFRRRR